MGIGVEWRQSWEPERTSPISVDGGHNYTGRRGHTQSGVTQPQWPLSGGREAPAAPMKVLLCGVCMRKCDLVIGNATAELKLSSASARERGAGKTRNGSRREGVKSLWIQVCSMCRKKTTLEGVLLRFRGTGLLEDEATRGVCD